MQQAFINFSLSAVVLVSIVMGALYLRFRWGLATRLLGLLAVTCVLASASSLFVGLTGGDIRAQTISSVVMTPPILGLFYVMYRMVVSHLDHVSAQLVTNSAQLAATAKEAAATASQQAATVTELTATITEVAETSRAASESARNVARTGEQAVVQGNDGVEAIAQARQVLALVTQVNEIVETVSGLADQSNFLAVNAGIEAAKAGEQGRGFAVVASEVRSLAEQSKLATQRIRKALHGAADGRRALDSVQTIVADLARLLEQGSDHARHISASTNQQAAGISQISDAMGNLSMASQNVASTARQLEAAVSSLEALALETRRYVTGRS